MTNRIVSLLFLTTAYIVGEVAHWLPSTTSKSLANALHFGDSTGNCTEPSDETCVYLGSGQEAQYLFSVYFVIPLTISVIIFGDGILYLNCSVFCQNCGISKLTF